MGRGYRTQAPARTPCDTPRPPAPPASATQLARTHLTQRERVAYFSDHARRGGGRVAEGGWGGGKRGGEGGTCKKGTVHRNEGAQLESFLVLHPTLQHLRGALSVRCLTPVMRHCCGVVHAVHPNPPSMRTRGACAPSPRAACPAVQTVSRVHTMAESLLSHNGHPRSHAEGRRARARCRGGTRSRRK